MLIITCIEITIFQSFTMLKDERKRQVDLKGMTLVMVNFFNDGFHVVNKAALLIVEVA